MTRTEIEAYMVKKFNTKPAYLFKKYPQYAVFRHQNNKWYALIMNIAKMKLGLEGKENIEILNLKCGEELNSLLKKQPNFLPAYHMNKKHWITIILDETLVKEDIYTLINLSYDLTK